MTTLAPKLPNNLAEANPIPELAPVMIITLSLKKALSIIITYVSQSETTAFEAFRPRVSPFPGVGSD